MSQVVYRAGIKARGESSWSYNSLRFDTAEEAYAYARDLAGRWAMVKEYRVERNGPEGWSVVGEEVSV